MSQVTLLLADSIQPVENKRESSGLSSSGDADRFANLVEQHIEERGREKNHSDQRSGKESPDERNQTQHANHSSSAKVDAKNRDKNDNDQSYDSSQESAVKESVGENKLGTSVTENKTSRSEAEMPQVDADTSEADSLTVQASVKLTADQANEKSQALLNLLAASGDLLVKTEKSAAEEPSQELTDGSEPDFSQDTLKQLFDKNKVSQSLEQASEKLARQFTSHAVMDENVLKDSQKVASLDANLDQGEAQKTVSSELILTNALTKQVSKAASDAIAIEQMKATVKEAEQKAAKTKLNSELENSTENKTLNALLTELNQQQSGDTQVNDEMLEVDQQLERNGKSISVDKQLLDAEKKQASITLDTDLSAKSIDEVSESLQVAQVNKNDIEAIKSASVAVSNGGDKHSSTRLDVNLAQSEQGNKDQQAKQAQQTSQEEQSDQLSDELNIEKSIKGVTVSDKSMVAETLAQAQMNTGVNATRAQAEHISETANEQLVEHLASRVVKENVQVQKTQLAMDTISIYRKDFANEVKEKVMVMINQKLQQVDIQLDPPELGNMHVRVNLQNEQASVSFMVQNSQAKEALEQHMGKLKDMLADSGVDVGNANIEQQSQSPQEQQQENHAGQEQGDNHSEDNVDVATLSGNMVKASALGVDFYA